MLDASIADRGPRAEASDCRFCSAESMAVRWAERPAREDSFWARARWRRP